MPTPERFPTLLALSATSYSVLARSVAEMMRHFSWTTFNLLCDKNPDPSQIQAVEVICALILAYVQNNARELSTVVNYFDSSHPETYRTVLRESRRHSSSKTNVPLFFFFYSKKRNESINICFHEDHNSLTIRCDIYFVAIFSCSYIVLMLCVVSILASYTDTYRLLLVIRRTSVMYSLLSQLQVKRA